MESSGPKSKEDRRRTKRNPSDPIYSANPSKAQVRPRPRDACYVEQRSFERLTSAEGEWAIRESSAVRFAVQRAGRLDC